eukprot:8029054-Pyramimonas_sp.AAC.1
MAMSPLQQPPNHNQQQQQQPEAAAADDDGCCRGLIGHRPSGGGPAMQRQARTRRRISTALM